MRPGSAIGSVCYVDQLILVVDIQYMLLFRGVYVMLYRLGIKRDCFTLSNANNLCSIIFYSFAQYYCCVCVSILFQFLFDYDAIIVLLMIPYFDLEVCALRLHWLFHMRVYGQIVS